MHQLARDGHLILKTIDDQKTAIFYIPEVVTNRQIEWFEYNKFELLHNDLIGAFSINSDEEELEQEKEEASAIKEKLSKIMLKINVKAGENGKIFGSITAKEIATELQKQYKIEVDKKKILLKEPIKEIGTFTIDIKLYEGIIGKLKIDIIA